MPSIVALLLVAGAVLWLFWRDLRQEREVSAVLWLPIIWFIINCSRTFVQWLQIFGGGFSGSYEEGTPVDAVANLLMLVAALLILQRRQVRLAEVFRHNRVLVLFFGYCLLAVLWSDYPFISLKRWIKVLGHPAMVLLVLTERNPVQAFITLMKRCAFFLIPFSILLIKYYPQWGRGFDSWSGLPSNTGVTTNKNILGCVCFIFGFFFAWLFHKNWDRRRDREGRVELLVIGGFLLATIWLLKLAQSSTALGTFGMALGMFVFAGFRFVHSANIARLILFGGLTFLVANWAFELIDHVIRLLGRDPTLTDRTIIWREVLKFDINPILGTGFEAFWLGERRARMTEIFFWEPNQAHNGYLETYLCLGLVGLALMLALILTAFFKAVALMDKDLSLARYRLGFLAGFVVYNWTEAAFKALHPMWFVFFLILIELPRENTSAASNPEPENEPVEPENEPWR